MGTRFVLYVVRLSIARSFINIYLKNLAIGRIANLVAGVGIRGGIKKVRNAVDIVLRID